MATLGSLIVNVLANTSHFAKGMAKARAELAGFTASANHVKNAAGSLNGVLATVGVGFSVHQIISGLKSTADTIDHLADVSDRIGITTENLIGLQHAASYSGVEAEQLTAGLQALSKQLGEAVHGGGKAKDVLKELGLNASKLANQSPDKSLLEIAKAFGQVDTQAEKVRMGMRLFGSDGAAMVNFLDQGESSIRKFMREADRLGLTYSREEAEKVAKFNDAWMRLSKTLESIGTELVIRVAPDAMEFLEGVQEIAKGLGAKDKSGRGYLEREFPVTRRFVNWMTGKQVQEDIAGGIETEAPAFTARELGGDKQAERFREYLNGVPSMERERQFAVRRLTEKLMNGVGSRLHLKELQQAPEIATQGLRQLKQWKREASEFGAQWSREQFFKSLMPKPKSQFFIDQEKKLAERDQKRIDEMRQKQYGERFMVRGVNSALQGGTAEAFQAIAESRIQQSLLDHAKKQLEEARKQTDQLAALNSNLFIETTGIN